MSDLGADPPARPRVIVLVGDPSGKSYEAAVRGLALETASMIVPRHNGGPTVEQLERAVGAPVTETSRSVRLAPGHVYIVPGDHDVEVTDGELRLGHAAPDDGGGLYDRLLRRLAPLGRDLLVAVTPGGAATAELGLRRIKESGGFSIQIVDGHAGTVHGAGPCEVAATPSELVARVRAFERVPVDGPLFDDPHQTIAVIQDSLRDILSLMRVRTGHDFTNYKRATLYRRIARRMQVHQTDSLVVYERLLREDPEELAFLLRDFLISVTNFFRDPDAFQALVEHVIPPIFNHHRSGEAIRIWVAGCATGEEAYSIAMLFAEHAARVNGPPIQIFATDIDEPSIAEARIGRYPASIATDVSVARLERFFDRDGDGYKVRRELRDMILFSPHNVLRDPPFSRLDLVTCRNVLIYLNREAQERVLNMLHFGLRGDGFLFLGMSESAESIPARFSPVDPKLRLFARRVGNATLGFDALVATGRFADPVPQRAVPAVERSRIAGDVHHRLVEYYAPPSVLINEDLDVVHVSEHAGPYLALAGGEPTRQLLRLVIAPLRLDLRSALYAVRQSGQTSETRRVRFADGAQTRMIEMTVRAADLPDVGRGVMLVVFDEHAREPGVPAPSPDAPSSQLEPVVREIEGELNRTREQLRTTIEQYETSLEELKASNEELHAINEELRSATEELETGKEEQQSVNEELVTLNHELKTKVDEVIHANSDLQNLMTSTDIGVVFLDRSLCIKRFTPRAQELINVIASDIGRPLAHLTHQLEYDGLPDAARDVLQTLRTFEREVASKDGRGSFLVRLLPYRSVDDRIEGVVVTFVNITELRNAQAALSLSEGRFSQALRAAPLIALSQDADLRFTWGVLLGREIDAVGRGDAELFGAAEAERLVPIKRQLLADRVGRRVEITMNVDNEERVFDFRLETIERGGQAVGIRSLGFDITPSKIAENALREADARKDQFLATVSHELRSPLMPMVAALDIQRMANGDLARIEKARGVLDRQVNHVIRLVDDLLDLSRVAQDKISMVREPVRLAAVMQQALEQVRPRVEAARQRLTVDPLSEEVEVMGDVTRLDQVLVNVLTNASKYTQPNGSIVVHNSVDLDAGTVTVSVVDDGIGIEPDLLPRVFDLFVQAREVIGRTDGGLGIGLNLVRRLVELHGGTVSVHSAGAGQGTEVRVTLPVIRRP